MFGFSTVAHAITAMGIGQALITNADLPNPAFPAPGISAPGRKSSAPRRRRSPTYRWQGAKEHARRHNAAGFQPIKVTPRRDGDFAFAYMDIPDGKSRQVRRAEHRRHVKRFGY